jgi:hypothetical protein
MTMISSPNATPTSPVEEEASPARGAVTTYGLFNNEVGKSQEEIPVRIARAICFTLSVLSPDDPGEIRFGALQRESKKGLHRISTRFGIHGHNQVFYVYEDGHYEVHKIEYAGFSVTLTLMGSSNPATKTLSKESWKDWKERKNRQKLLN